ncbi:MAG: GNAT family N-acetyltransferase [Candidatus Bathyarchaeia archaeon]
MPKLLSFEKINVYNFSKVPKPCKFCLYWQTSSESQREISIGNVEREKLNWLERVEKAFGNCVQIACLDDTTIGFMQYAPAKYFPRVNDYISGPPSGDAVFIACLYITSKNDRRKGYGTLMLLNLVKESRKRGFWTVETFARADSDNNPSGPLAFYLKNGFKVTCQKDDFPLVRLRLNAREASSL